MSLIGGYVFFFWLIICFYAFCQAPGNRKSQKNTKAPGNAGRVNKQPPGKSTTAGSSSRQTTGLVKGGVPSKNSQKAIGKQPVRETVVEKSSKMGNKRKAAEAVEVEDEERMITRAFVNVADHCMNEADIVVFIGSEIPKMPMLKARVRHIPQDVVESKWGPLAEKTREEVLDVVKAAERPVLMTFRKEKQRTEAQEALRVVIKKYDPNVFFISESCFWGCVGLQYD